RVVVVGRPGRLPCGAGCPVGVLQGLQRSLCAFPGDAGGLLGGEGLGPGRRDLLRCGLCPGGRRGGRGWRGGGRELLEVRRGRPALRGRLPGRRRGRRRRRRWRGGRRELLEVRRGRPFLVCTRSRNRGLRCDRQRGGGQQQRQGGEAGH